MLKPPPPCLPSSLVATREQLAKLTEEEREFLLEYRDPEPKKEEEPDSYWFIDVPEVRKILGIPW